MQNTRYITTKKFGTLKITQGDDSLWRTEDGTIIAYADYVAVDPVARCGIGIASLPPSNPLTNACSVHDYLYSSPAYQAFHTRKEADDYLEFLISQEPSKWSLLAKPFKLLSRLFGAKYWENSKTR